MEFLLLAEATIIHCRSWKLVTRLSKWANKRKEQVQLHILKLFLVQDGLGRLQLALTRLTLYSDPRDHFWSKNLVLQTNCPSEGKSKTLLHILEDHPLPLYLYLSSDGFSLFNLSFYRTYWGLGVEYFTIGPLLWMILASLSDSPCNHLGLIKRQTCPHRTTCCVERVVTLGLWSEEQLHAEKSQWCHFD